jgi:hypothetical protein
MSSEHKLILDKGPLNLTIGVDPAKPCICRYWVFLKKSHTWKEVGGGWIGDNDPSNDEVEIIDPISTLVGAQLAVIYRLYKINDDKPKTATTIWQSHHDSVQYENKLYSFNGDRALEFQRVFKLVQG